MEIFRIFNLIEPCEARFTQVADGYSIHALLRYSRLAEHEVYQSDFRAKSSSYCQPPPMTQREFHRPSVKIPPVWAKTADSKYHRYHDCQMSDMMRILLVEDSEDVLYLLRLQLESIGYAIDAASNATSALEAAQRTQPDVIVSGLTDARHRRLGVHPACSPHSKPRFGSGNCAHRSQLGLRRPTGDLQRFHRPPGEARRSN